MPLSKLPDFLKFGQILVKRFLNVSTGLVGYSPFEMNSNGRAIEIRNTGFGELDNFKVAGLLEVVFLNEVYFNTKFRKHKSGMAKKTVARHFYFLVRNFICACHLESKLCFVVVL